MGTASRVLLCIVLLGSVASCSAGSRVGGPATGASSAVPSFPSPERSPLPAIQSNQPLGTASPLPGPSTGPQIPVPEARWGAILEVLTQKGVKTDSVEVVSSKLVEWPDGSLGCPQPQTQYQDVITEGMQVIVSADGATYDFRFGPSDHPLLCEGHRR